MGTSQTVAIVIVTWNNRTYIDACIRSVLNQQYGKTHLMVIDNASEDGTPEYVRANYPQVTVQANRTNFGFAKAHNWGIDHTDSTYYMPLNPDMVLEPTYVAEMVEAAAQDDRIGAVAGRLLLLDDQGGKTDTGYSTGHLLTKSRSPSNRGYKEDIRGRYLESDEIFAANGAAPLYRRAMLDDVALDGEYFCGDFFMYGEDHDLGWRAQLRSWRCIYAPGAVGFHAGYGSGGIGRFDVQVQFTRNRYLTLVRNDQLDHFVRDFPFVLAYEFTWQCAKLLQSPRRLIAHWSGIVQAVQAIPRTLESRRNIQRQRTATSEHIRHFYVTRLW